MIVRRYFYINTPLFLVHISSKSPLKTSKIIHSGIIDGRIQYEIHYFSTLVFAICVSKKNITIFNAALIGWHLMQDWDCTEIAIPQQNTCKESFNKY